MLLLVSVVSWQQQTRIENMCLYGVRCLIPGLNVSIFKLHCLLPSVEVAAPSFLTLLKPLLLSLNCHTREMRQVEGFSKLLGGFSKSSLVGWWRRPLVVNIRHAPKVLLLASPEHVCGCACVLVVTMDGWVTYVTGTRHQENTVSTTLNSCRKHGRRGGSYLKQKQTW